MSHEEVATCATIHLNLFQLNPNCDPATPAQIEMLVMAAAQIQLDTALYWTYRWLTPEMSIKNEKKKNNRNIEMKLKLEFNNYS